MTGRWGAHEGPAHHKQRPDVSVPSPHSSSKQKSCPFSVQHFLLFLGKEPLPAFPTPLPAPPQPRKIRQMGAKGLCTCCLHSLCAPGPSLPSKAQVQVSASSWSNSITRWDSACGKAGPCQYSGSPVFVHRGVGAMEIVAMDMKVSGMYIARQLSFSGVTFRIEEIPLDPTFERVYNRAALLVSRVARGL